MHFGCSYYQIGISPISWWSSPIMPSCFTINYSSMVYSHLSPYCTSTINLGPWLGIWPMSQIWVKHWRRLVGFISDLFIFLLYPQPHFPLFTWFQISFFLVLLDFFPFQQLGGEDTSIMEGGRWNRESLLQSMVTCTVYAHITCRSYLLQYHHLPSLLYTGEAPHTIPVIKGFILQVKCQFVVHQTDALGRKHWIWVSKW